MPLTAVPRVGEATFNFEAKIPSEILRPILSYNLPPLNEQSHFVSLAHVNKRWSGVISDLLLSWISIPAHLDLKNGEQLVEMLSSRSEKRFQVKCLEVDGSDLARRLITLLPNIQTLILRTKAEGILTYFVPPLPNIRILEVQLAGIQLDDPFLNLQHSRELRSVTIGSRLDWTKTLSTLKFEKLDSLNLRLWNYNQTIFDAFIPSCFTLRNITLLRVQMQDFKVINDFLSVCKNPEVLTLQADFQHRNTVLLHLPNCLRVLDLGSVLFYKNQEPLELGVDAGCFFSNLANNSQLQELRISGVALKDPRLYGVLPKLRTCVIRRDIVFSDDGTLFKDAHILAAVKEVDKSYLACLEPCLLQEHFRFLVISGSLLEDPTVNNLVRQLGERRPAISLSVQFESDASFRSPNRFSEILTALMKFPILHLSGLNSPNRNGLYALNEVLHHQQKNIVLFSCDVLLFNYLKSGLDPFENLKAMIIPVEFGTRVLENLVQFCERKGVEYLCASVSQSAVTGFCRRYGIWD
ncbi:hypothetical protein BT69DRAFT_1326756 [Atractiella rhizophila]|nr:hypothetical protein BT69DRAFT_1326756 [Atractiella rhizophila]